MKKTLLEIAKEHSPGKVNKIFYSKESLDLSIAWIHSEITTKQFGLALDLSLSSSYYQTAGLYKIALLLREAVRRGDIEKIQLKGGDTTNE